MSDFDPQAWIDDAGYATETEEINRMMSALKAVLGLHRPRPIYGHEDLCDNTSDLHVAARHFETGSGEWVCMDIDTDETLCASCLDTEGFPAESPCDTWTAITEALRDEETG